MELYMDNVKIVDMEGIDARLNEWGGIVMYIRGSDTTTTGKLVLHNLEVRRIMSIANIRRVSKGDV